MEVVCRELYFFLLQVASVSLLSIQEGPYPISIGRDYRYVPTRFRFPHRLHLANSHLRRDLGFFFFSHGFVFQIVSSRKASRLLSKNSSTYGSLANALKGRITFCLYKGKGDRYRCLELCVVSRLVFLFRHRRSSVFRRAYVRCARCFRRSSSRAESLQRGRYVPFLCSFR